MLRLLIQQTAWSLDPRRRPRASAHGLDVQLPGQPAVLRGRRPGDAGRTAASATAAHMPFEHIYRHHRRYRITEGSEEMQMRRVAGNLFGFISKVPEGRRPRPPDHGNFAQAEHFTAPQEVRAFQLRVFGRGTGVGQLVSWSAGQLATRIDSGAPPRRAARSRQDQQSSLCTSGDEIM